MVTSVTSTLTSALATPVAMVPPVILRLIGSGVSALRHTLGSTVRFRLMPVTPTPVSMAANVNKIQQLLTVTHVLVPKDLWGYDAKLKYTNVHQGRVRILGDVWRIFLSRVMCVSVGECTRASTARLRLRDV